MPAPTVPATTPTPSTTPTSGGQGQLPDILNIRSEAELRKIAESQVNLDIFGQESTYERDLTRTTGRENRALTELNKMYGGILPYVAESAKGVARNYQQAAGVQTQIFKGAAEQMSRLKQSRAAEAQALSQQMGGPVAMDDFTSPLSDYENVAPLQAAGAQLYALGQAEAGVQESAAWAGRVMPALRTEDEAKTRNFYEERINGLQDQITAIESQRGTMVDARFNDLMTSERQTALSVQQQQLDKLQADRDYEVALKNLELDKERFAMDTSHWSAEFAQKKDEAKVAHLEFGRTAKLQEVQAYRDWQLSNKQMTVDAQHWQAEMAADLAKSKESIREFKDTHQLDTQRAKHDWDLSGKQLHLDKLRERHDWKATQKQLHQEAFKNRLASKQFKIEEAQLTGKYKGKKTLAARKQAADISLARKELKQRGAEIKQRAKESDRDYRARVQKMWHDMKVDDARIKLDSKITRAKIKSSNKHTHFQLEEEARTIINDLIHGTSDAKPFNADILMPVHAPSATARLTDPKFRHVPKLDKQGNVMRKHGKPVYEWVYPVKKVITPPAGRVHTTSAQVMYKLLVRSGVPDPIARSVILAKTGKTVGKKKRGK